MAHRILNPRTEKLRWMPQRYIEACSLCFRLSNMDEYHRTVVIETSEPKILPREGQNKIKLLITARSFRIICLSWEKYMQRHPSPRVLAPMNHPSLIWWRFCDNLLTKCRAGFILDQVLFIFCSSLFCLIHPSNWKGKSNYDKNMSPDDLELWRKSFLLL